MKHELTEMQMFRAQELLMARATLGLTDIEADELVSLGADEDLSFDLAAAAIDIATLDPRDLEAGLPPALADKVLVAAGGAKRRTRSDDPSSGSPTESAGGAKRRPPHNSPGATHSDHPSSGSPTESTGAARGGSLPAIPTTLAGVVAPPTLSRPSVKLPGDTEQWATGDVPAEPASTTSHSPDQWGDVQQRRTQGPPALAGAPPTAESGRIREVGPAPTAESGRIREVGPPPGQSLPQVEPQQAPSEPGRSRSVPSTRLNVASLDEARAKKRSKAAVIGWVAAAACAILAAGAWLWASRKDAPTEVATKTLTPSEARAELLASAKDTATLAWTATADAAAKGASGDVVWSASAQRGYMRFVNLAPNNPTELQYQLWIFDKDRDDKFPVDGGVFDVSSTGEVIVPISAKLRVSDATLFAVTVEKPGGVVVSKRERIVVTATPRAS